jgi:hypothetical protein
VLFRSDLPSFGATVDHRRSRSIDLSRGAVGSGAHGVQIWACFARRPRMVQLVSALLRRPHAPDRWSTVAPNDGRSRQPAVGVDGRSRPTPLDRRTGVLVLPLSGALGSNSAAVSARHELRWRLQSCRMSFRFT